LSWNEITDVTSAATMNAVWLRDNESASSPSVVRATGGPSMTLAFQREKT
jgi:hypothetical protein